MLPSHQGANIFSSSGQVHGLVRTTFQLPQDVIDCIIGCVEAEDYDTLLACCLTSRVLFESATKMLFRHLDIKQRYYPSVLEQLRNSQFKATSVRHLQFTGPIKGSQYPLLSDEVSAVLFCLPFVNRFSVQGFLWKITNRDAAQIRNLTLSLPNAQSITHISLHGTLFDSDLDLLVTLRAFPRLNKLAMHSAYWYKDLNEMIRTMDVPSNIPVIRVLDVQWTGSHLVPYLFPHNAAHQLESIALEGYHRLMIPDWWQLFNEEEVYGNLRHITCYDFVSNRRSVPVTLPNTPNLKSLVLRDMLITGRHVRVSAHGPSIRTALQQITSTSLEELGLWFVGVLVKDLELLAVDEWLQFLDLPKFASLDRVVYRFAGRSLAAQKDVVEDLVVRAHGSWARRHVIEVVVEDSVA